jgi:hypothetical protein
MQKALRFTLLLSLLMLVFAIQAQENSALPTIAYTQDNTLNLYYPETGTSELLLDESSVPYTFFYRATWSPDGSRLAYLRPDDVDTSLSTLIVRNADGQEIPVVSANFNTPFAPNWIDNEHILYAAYTGEHREFVSVLNAFSVAVTENAEPQLLGTFDVSEGCGGGTNDPAQSDYYTETTLGGSREVFTLTPFGLVHDGQCVGAEVTLTNLETGESTRFAGGGLSKAVVSADGSQVIGLKENHLTVVNLANMSVSTVASSAMPDQYIWVDNNRIIYSSYENAGDLLEGHSADEIALITAVIGSEPESIARHRVSIHALNLSDGSDEVLYSADAYAIGRMAVRDNWLLFSQVENDERWVQGMIDGTITADNNFQQSQDIVYTQLFALNLESLEATLLLNDAQQMTVAPSN